ncbi:Wzz/FepE/Etk N-terminal domain-containing protein [Francisellaceae bacterium CB300]
MLEFKKDEYIEISLTKMVKALLDNIKTFMFFIILGVIITIGLVTAYKPTYNYSMYVSPPVYKNYKNTSNSNSVSSSIETIVNNNQTLLVLNAILSRGISDGVIPASAKIDSKPNTFDKDINIELSLSLKNHDKKSIENLYNQLNKNYIESSVYLNSMQELRLSIDSQMSINKESIDKYNAMVSNDHKYLKALSSQKGLQGMAAQTLLASYLNRIDNYQQHIYDLEKDQKYLQLELTSIEKGLSSVGGYNVEKKDKTLVIIIIGFIMSIMFGCIAVFTKIFIRQMNN